MSNFFSSPQIQQTPNPEPPGYNLIRQMMLQRLMQQFTNPYGMSPGGMANWQGFNTGSRPFDPTGGFSSQGGSPGYSYLTNQGMPGMGGGGGQNAGMGQLLQAIIAGMGSGGGMGQGAGGSNSASGMSPNMAPPGGMQYTPIRMQQGSPVTAINPVGGGSMGTPISAMMPQARSTMPQPQQTSNYDGTVVGYGGNAQPSALLGYGGNVYGAPMSHGAMPHLLGLLRMAHTQPRGAVMGGPRPGGAAMMPTPMPTHGMAMPIPMGRRG